MRSAPWILLAASMAAAACADDGGSPPPDRDGDGVVATFDCDDSNPSAHTTVTASPDADGDGVGSGPASTFCTGGTAPPGHAREGGDCAPSDGSAWRTIDLADADGDGYTARAPTPLCAGATLPDPYRATALGNDCDDRDDAVFRWVVVHRDQDGDGVGARPRSIVCAGAALSAGWSTAGYDVDDLDGSIARDPADEDLAWLLE